MMPAQYAEGHAAAEPTPGGFGIRFAARLVDSLLGLVFGFIGGFVGAIVVALTRGPRALATGHNLLASPTRCSRSGRRCSCRRSRSAPIT